MLFNFLSASMVDNIKDTISKLAESVTLDNLSMLALILTGATIITAFVITRFSIEVRTARAIKNINRYLEETPFIDDDNLVEFNKIMKTIPKPMRHEWQQYVLNRSEKPSKYLSQENCLERPFKTSAYAQTIDISYSFINILALLVLTLSLSKLSTATEQLGYVLYNAFMIPALIFVFGTLFRVFLIWIQKVLVSDIYYNFTEFTKKIDKACESMPNFIDYEILFSRKEIKNGIPVLQEYLEQRTLYEEEQIKKAKESEILHDRYNFKGLEIGGALVMERAMKESEFYIGNKRRLEQELDQLESEKDNYKRSYLESQKTDQRKLRDINESLSRLQDSLKSATNKIDGNYIRKQQAEEVKKMQEIEKSLNEVETRYKKDVSTVDGKINEVKKELEEKRTYLEKAITQEFGEYSKKVYDELEKVAGDRNQVKIDEYEKERDEAVKTLEERENLYSELEVLYNEKVTLSDALAEDVDLKNKAIEEINEDFRRLKQKKVVERYFDANGHEFFYDKEGNPYYHDEKGKTVYYEDDDVLEEEVEEAFDGHAIKKESAAESSKQKTKKEMKADKDELREMISELENSTIKLQNEMTTLQEAKKLAEDERNALEVANRNANLEKERILIENEKLKQKMEKGAEVKKEAVKKTATKKAATKKATTKKAATKKTTTKKAATKKTTTTKKAAPKKATTTKKAASKTTAKKTTTKKTTTKKAAPKKTTTKKTVSKKRIDDELTDLLKIISAEDAKKTKR